MFLFTANWYHILVSSGYWVFTLELPKNVRLKYFSTKLIFLDENESYKDSDDSCHIKNIFESLILAHFEDPELCLSTKYNNFLGACSILAKNLTNTVRKIVLKL